MSVRAPSGFSGPVATGADELPTVMEVALVLWSGEVGGAERLVGDLARAFRDHGARATVVFIGAPGPLTAELDRNEVTWISLGCRRGRNVMLAPGRYARRVGHVGRDGVLLMECGFAGVALRAGGYRAPIVAVEHGALLAPRSPLRRLVDRRFRALAARAHDREVAVSDYVLGRMQRGPHCSRLLRIHNGVDTQRFRPRLPESESPETDEIVVGFVGRLIAGKGVELLIRACAELRRRELPVCLRIAGDGPHRHELARVAADAGIESYVEFCGLVSDVPVFWSGCDLAAHTPHTLIESFCIAAVEAMTCGKPVVATKAGGLPEVVQDGVTGFLVEAADLAGIVDALTRYVTSPQLRADHGRAARQRAVDCFSLEVCAQSYVEIFRSLAPDLRYS